MGPRLVHASFRTSLSQARTHQDIVEGLRQRLLQLEQEALRGGRGEPRVDRRATAQDPDEHELLADARAEVHPGANAAKNRKKREKAKAKKKAATVAAAAASASADDDDVECDETLCVICMSRPREVVLLPCKHRCCCIECAPAPATCPMCRTAVSDRMKVFG